jgi:hypothetical protein
MNNKTLRKRPKRKVHTNERQIKEQVQPRNNGETTVIFLTGFIIWSGNGGLNQVLKNHSTDQALE